MADVKWIKIATNMFDNRKIKLIEVMPEGDAIIAIWFKLLCLAGTTNDSGTVYFTKDIPYTEEMLASIFSRPLTTVRLAIATFKKFEMVEIVDDFIQISNWEKYQNLDGLDKIREQTRKRVALHRLKQKTLQSNETQCNVICNATVTQCNALDKEEDKDKEVLKESIIKEKNQPFSPKIPKELQELFDYWNSKGIVVHRTINEKMVQLLKKALDLYGQAQIKQAIENYSIVLNDSTYYFSTRWTIGDFVKQTNALPDFLPEGIKWINYQEYLKKSKKVREQDKYEIENSNKPAMEGMEIL